METLLLLEDEHMRDMGMPIGHALKLKKKLKECEPEDACPQDRPQDPAISEDVKEHSTDYGKQPSDYVRPASLKVNSPAALAVVPSPQPQPTPGGSLSHEMIDSVKASWILVTDLGLENVAELLYKNLFQVAPVTKEVFPLSVRMRHRDWASPKDEDPNDPGDSPALRKLFCKVLEAVGTAVAGLQDMKTLVPHLTALGMRHINYNMKAEYFQYGGQAVLLTLKAGLGNAFTKDVELAWGMVYDFVSAAIVSGLHMAQAREAELKQLMAEKSSDTSERGSSGKLSNCDPYSARDLPKAMSVPEDLGHGAKVSPQAPSQPEEEFPKALTQPEEEFPPYQKQPSIRKRLVPAASFAAASGPRAHHDDIEYQYRADWHWHHAIQEKVRVFESPPREPPQRKELPTLLTAFASEIRGRVCR